MSVTMRNVLIVSGVAALAACTVGGDTGGTYYYDDMDTLPPPFFDTYYDYDYRHSIWEHWHDGDHHPDGSHLPNGGANLPDRPIFPGGGAHRPAAMPAHVHMHMGGGRRR